MASNGILKLNDLNVRSNPTVWSHDPSMMWDLKTRRYYSYSTDVFRPGSGLTEKIGIPVKSSEDLVNFRYEGTVLSPKAVAEGRNNWGYPDTAGFWAPYVEYEHGEYRMYYSATRAFGSSESRIWLAVSDSPLGPFENRGTVADTWGTDDTYPNAIDAHVVHEGENSYLIYGSFFGGIFIKELDGKTGLARSGNPKDLGTCISKEPEWSSLGGPEGASVTYVPETGYYYLFQSYGWLGDNYDIRVGRSKNPMGPYVDPEGKNLAGESLGLKLAGSYRFKAENPYAVQDGEWSFGGFRGPGHGVPFYDPVSQRWFFVHHIRDGAPNLCVHDEKEDRDSYQVHYMMIRPMFFRDGWPVFGPEPYQKENFEPVSPEEVQGVWELIVLDDKDNKIKDSVEIELTAESEYLRKGIIYKCFDFENQKEVSVVSGINDSGLAYWGKFLYSTV